MRMGRAAESSTTWAATSFYKAAPASPAIPLGHHQSTVAVICLVILASPLVDRHHRPPWQLRFGARSQLVVENEAELLAKAPASVSVRRTSPRSASHPRHVERERRRYDA